jgi:hypothetical protein
VIDSVDQCINQAGPASNMGCPLPKIVSNTIIRSVPAAGAAAAAPVPSRAVLPATASSLSVSNLSLAQRISITRLRLQGLRASMRVKEGTNVVRIAIYKARDGRKTGRALFVTNRAPRAAGLLRVTLRSSSLLKKLKAGSYVMEVRAGTNAASLGAVRRIAFRVTR